MAPKLGTSLRISGRRKAPAAKSTALKATRGAKYVLFLGDEGMILVYLKDNKVLSRQFIPDASEQNLLEFKESFADDVKAPIFLVIDTMDQSYIPQALPPVSALSVGKLIKRRLDRDFGANDIKGSILLGRDKTGRKDWNFLMIAIERTPLISTWLDFVSALPNRFAGIFLLSAETQNIVKSIDRAMGAPKEGGPEWKFFVSHNKVGGFRQVILRHGRIIFTRMTQPIGESTPEVIAGNIEQETLNTIEYMKRLGYAPQSGLDIYIVASNAVRSSLDVSKLNARIVHVLTPYEVAQQLGIEGATQPGDQFGDVILAACIGCNKTHILTLSIPQFKQLDTLYQLIYYQRIIAGVAIAGSVLYAGINGFETYGWYTQIAEATQQKSRKQAELDALKAQIQKSNMDVEKSSDIIDLYQTLLTEKVSPTPVLSRAMGIVKPPAYIKSVDWAVLDSAKVAAAAATAAAPPPPEGAPAPVAKPVATVMQMSATFTIEIYDSSHEPEKLKALANKLLESFKEAFPGYQVSYPSLPAGFGDNEKVEMNFNKTDEAQTPATKAIDLQLVVKGNVDGQPMPVTSPAASRPIPAPMASHAS